MREQGKEDWVVFGNMISSKQSDHIIILVILIDKALTRKVILGYEFMILGLYEHR